MSLKSDKNNRNFTYRSIKVLILSRSFFIIMRNVSDEICRENHNTHFLLNNFFFFEDRVICKKSGSVLQRQADHR